MKKLFHDLHKVGELLTLGIQIALVMLVPVLGGIYLDRYMGTTPLWLLTGMLVGFAGFINLIWRLFISNPKHKKEQNQDE